MRYDIRPVHTYDDDTEGATIVATEWVVVDTANRYAPAGYVYANREDALAQARRMG